MNSTLRYYLGEVLGLDLVPRKSASQPKIEYMAILCSHSLNSAEETLLKKMMMAAGIRDYRVSDQAPPGPGHGLVFGSMSAESLGLSELGASTDREGRRWLRTYALGDLLSGSEGEIQSRKRIAWGHLQTIKVWLKESAH